MMRISVNEWDAGYKAWRVIKNKQAIHVFLDDVEQRHVITADDDAGLVVVQVRDAAAGKAVLNESRDAVQHVELRGKVRIEHAS